MEEEQANEIKTDVESKVLIKPLWNKDSNVHFLSRTLTSYSFCSWEDLRGRGMCENRLLENLLEFLPKGTVIAGGFATAVMLGETNAKDIDIFCLSEDAFIKTYKLLTEKPEVLKELKAWSYEGYKVEQSLGEISENMRFVNFKHDKRPDIQLMKIVWYDSAEHVIDSFDLTISQFAFTKEGLFMNPLSVFDLNRKRLVLHRMQFPTSTFRRIIKYSKKGYYACPGSLQKITEEILAFKQNNPEVSDFVSSEVYVD